MEPNERWKLIGQLVGNFAKLQTLAGYPIFVQERVQTQVAIEARPGAQWDQLRVTDGPRYTGQVKRLTTASKSKMEESLRESSKACKTAAAVLAKWIRDTHRTLLKLELWCDGLKQEVRSHQKGAQNLTAVVVDHEDRAERLEKIVLQQGLALVELRAKYEGRIKPGARVDLLTKGSTELAKVGRTIGRKSSSEAKRATGDLAPSESRQPSSKRSGGVGSRPSRISATETDIRIRDILKRLNGQTQGLDQRRSKGVSVSLVADTVVDDSGKVEAVPRTATKSEAPATKVTAKRKAVGQPEGGADGGGRIREIEKGKAAKLLLEVADPPRNVPGGKDYGAEAGKRHRETKDPRKNRMPGGAIQPTNSEAGQPVRHSGHAGRASSHGLGQGRVKSPTRGQEAAGNLVASQKQTGGGLFKQALPPKGSEQ